MNEPDFYRQLAGQLPSSVEALLALLRQALRGTEPTRFRFTSAEKLVLETLMMRNVAAEPNARMQRSTDPQVICHAAIARARDTSGVAIRLAQRLARPPARNPRREHTFGAVMCRFPGLARQVVSMRQRMLGRRDSHLRRLHGYVLSRLSHEGLGADEYPFTSRSYGYRAFCNWLRGELRRVPV